MLSTCKVTSSLVKRAKLFMFLLISKFMLVPVLNAPVRSIPYKGQLSIPHLAISSRNLTHYTGQLSMPNPETRPLYAMTSGQAQSTVMNDDLLGPGHGVAIDEKA